VNPGQNPPSKPENLTTDFTDNTDRKEIAVIAVIARHRRHRKPETQHLTTDFSDPETEKTYRGFARMNADQEEKAKTFETQRNGGSGGNK